MKSNEIFSEVFEILKKITKDVTFGTFSRDDEAGIIDRSWKIVKKFFYSEHEGEWKLKPEISSSLDVESLVMLYMMKDKLKKHEAVELFSTAKVIEKPEMINNFFDEKKILASIPEIYVDNVDKRDYLYLINFLAHADVPNKNKDLFLLEDLRGVIREGQFSSERPAIIDINHTISPAIGVTVYAQMAFDDEIQKESLLVYSVLFAWGPYKEIASYVLENIKNNDLKFSMMCLPEYVECSMCGKIARDFEDYCEHLQNRGNYNDVSRILRHPTFYSNSVIVPAEHAADIFARPLVLAGLIKPEQMKKIFYKGGDDMDPEKLKLQIEELTKANEVLKQENEGLKKDNENLNSQIASLRSEYETLKSENEQTKASLEAVTQEKEALQQENEKFKADQKEIATKVRLLEVSDIIKEFSDDEKKIVQVEAETKTDEQWNDYVKVLKKLTDVTDPHVSASVGNLSGDIEEASVLPNLRKALKN